MPEVVSGLYPLWESSGFVLAPAQARLGINTTSIGVWRTLQLGTSPSAFVFRVPNLWAKVGVYSKDGLHLALQAGAFGVLAGASKSFLSPQYASRLNNPDALVMVVPVSFAASWEVTPWLRLHNTVTAMGVFSKKLRSDVTVGDFLTAEFRAFQRHAVFLHTGEIGFWEHDQNVLGVSYRYNYHWFEVRLGYFYRFSKDGAQSAPLFDLGLVL